MTSLKLYASLSVFDLLGILVMLWVGILLLARRLVSYLR